MKVADRMKYFRKPVFSDLKAPRGLEPLDFTLGSPNIAPEPEIMKTIQEAAGKPENYKYAVKPLPELTEAVRSWYRERYETELAEEEICLLQGSQEALVNLPLVFCDPGDGVLIPDPYYPVYEQAPHLAGAEVLFMPLRAEIGYLVDFDGIPEEDRRRAKLMLVSYPNNPTGATAPDSFYEELIRFAKENDILVVHDNAYSELVFDGKPGKSFLSFPGAKDVGVELNSFSKTYGMAGARLGILAGNRKAVQAYRELKSGLDYGIFLPVQYGGAEALTHGGQAIRETRREYERRRDLMTDLFEKAGWKIPRSQATMFLWAPVPAGVDSEAFAKELADRTGILVTPGSWFGKEGEGFVRIALVQDEDRIREAAARLADSGLFEPADHPHSEA